MTRVVRVDARAPEPLLIAEAAGCVGRGGIVAFPTESFYGLGASALDETAVQRVFRVKGRPETKPLLVLVDSVLMAEALCAEIPAGARQLMAQHWPGPLTLVLRALPSVPASVMAGTGTVGIRMPSHPVALALVAAAGIPVTAPSANPTGEEPATTAQEVVRYFEDRVDLVLDGGPTAGGPGSTVADCTVWPPRVLRQGPVRL